MVFFLQLRGITMMVTNGFHTCFGHEANAVVEDELAHIRVIPNV